MATKATAVREATTVVAPTVGVTVYSRSKLVEFGSSSIELLMLDDLWTEAAEGGDTKAAVALGRRMEALIRDILKQHRGGLPKLLRGQREALNAAWPDMCERWGLSYHKIQALETYFAENGGSLGDAGAALAARFSDSLEDEANSLLAKIQELEEQGKSVGDLSWRMKAMLGVLVICAFTVVAAPIGLALAGGITAATATTQAATGLASVGATIAALAMTPGPAQATQRTKGGRRRRSVS